MHRFVSKPLRLSELSTMLSEAIREAARRAGLPADVITEVSELRPEALI